MSDFGIFCLDKGWFEHPVFDDQPFTEREAWAWMIAAAAPAERFRRIGQVRVLVKRGQLKHSHRFLAKRWQWSVARVQRFLAKLVAESMIESVTESGVTCVTLCNYDKYQPSVAVTESPTDQLPSQISKNQTTNTESNVDGGGDARARESIISEQAMTLANEVMRTLDIDPQFIPPGWCGAAMWMQAGLSSGWNPELVRIAAARIRAKRNYRQPYSYRYLLQPIVREHELANEPALPIPPISIPQSEVSHANAPADWRQRRDAQHAAFAEFRAANRELDPGEEGDRTVVRLVPNARRG